jgi:trimeric autotransporter adhesin
MDCGLGNALRILCLLAVVAFASAAWASPYHGQVKLGGLPVPGVTISLSRGGKTFSTTTDEQGRYAFPDVPDGEWTIEIQMRGFANIRETVDIAPNRSEAAWQLQMLPLSQMHAEAQSAIPPPANPAPAAPLRSNSAPTAEKNAQAQPQQPNAGAAGSSEEESNPLNSPGFLINGSTNNGAASPFAQFPAFGNNRNGSNGLYTGSIGVIVGNSIFDARPFSLSGQNTPKPSYSRLTAVATLGGPMKIPHLFRQPLNFFVAYQWTRNSIASTESALVPTEAERDGDFYGALGPTGQPIQIFNPSTGQSFPNNVIPQNMVSAQAEALLKLYPLPNVTGNPRYNFQIPLLADTHQDALQSRFDKSINNRNEVFGDFAFQSTRTGTPNLFRFLDDTSALGLNAGLHWSHRFERGRFFSLGYRFTRIATHVTPYWENRENISGLAGITGNNQDPMNWGPPTLTFSSGIAGLTDMDSSFDRNQTSAVSPSMLWIRGNHNMTLGGDFRRQEFNYLSQQNPRGTFTFTGAGTAGVVDGVTVGGYDLADFLLGIPDTSSVAFGNADKYFRQSVYDAYANDDWRISPQLTLNAGLRWEYGSPITELYGRLVNLDVLDNFLAVAPVVASDPVGPLTGEHYPDSLIRPDKHAVEPRVGFAWRPLPGSSLVVRGGYGIYYDTSVYQTLALQMAQQAPLSKSLSVQNSPGCPLTLADGFVSCSSITPNTFAVNPNFQPGYAQDWNFSVQRDLPGSLQLSATYLGIKGTHGPQEFLPNTYPLGALNPCLDCPAGFAYLASGGNSTRQAAQIQLRRRLHNGLTATLLYTFSKSIDDDSMLGGQGATASTQNTPQSPFTNTSAQSSSTTQSAAMIAQNWLDLTAERSLSSFDQRHLLSTQLQYTTGMGRDGKTLWRGWKGTLCKEWTVLSQIIVGSGLPQTPVYLAAVPGTGFTGTIRPDYTGAPIYSGPNGSFLNPSAYSAPAAGQWGTAGRNSITGPGEFVFNASLGRTFRITGRYNLDLRFDATNILNHVTYTAWDTAINSTQFGLPVTTNAMRSVQTVLRLRF